MSVDALAARIAEERGDTWIALLPRPPGTATDALAAVLAELPARPWDAHVAFREAPDGLPEIDRDRARRGLALALHRGMAHHDERLPAERAAALAGALVDALAPDARWWTNGDLGAAGPQLVVAGWTPLTTATFDTGVLGVDDHHVLVAWVVDED